MKTITAEGFLKHKAQCTGKATMDLVTDRESWTALDILALDIPNRDKLWMVLNEDLIDADVMHEFACRLVEKAKTFVPDLNMDAVRAKRWWLEKKITNRELSVDCSKAKARVSSIYSRNNKLTDKLSAEYGSDYPAEELKKVWITEMKLKAAEAAAAACSSWAREAALETARFEGLLEAYALKANSSTPVKWEDEAREIAEAGAAQIELLTRMIKEAETK